MGGTDRDNQAAPPPALILHWSTPPATTAVNSDTTPLPSTAATPALFGPLCALLCALALLPTVWTDLDLAAAQWFATEGASADMVHWVWIDAINRFLPAIFRACVIAALLGWVAVSVQPRGRNWRLALAFVFLSGALGPGLVVNSGFKEHWQRARPYQVDNFGGPQHFTRAGVITDQCDNNCSFVSGHVACGFFLASLMLIHPRRQKRWALAGLLAGAVIGFARMADMAHWLSDVLWAGPITLACSWLVWRLLLRIYPPAPAAEPDLGSPRKT